MIEEIEFLNKKYPKFQSIGNAAQFAIPYALKVCKGIGYDVGCNREEWKLPGAIPIDHTYGIDAMNLPEGKVDYIFSSHCLEHLENWVDALDHWSSRLRSGGVLFLYIPHKTQEYWLPWNNRKHKHVLDEHILKKYLESNGYTKIYTSGTDLNNSFMIMAEKIIHIVGE
jgi:SAM-dependent methyltransferase